jgi:hypothetical protein
LIDRDQAAVELLWSVERSGLHWSGSASEMQGIVGGKLKLKGIDKDKKYATAPVPAARSVHLDSLLAARAHWCV